MFHFAGFPAYVELAANELGLGDRRSLDEARRQAALTRLSNLIAGAMSCPKGAEAEVLREAGRSRDALAIALRAAELALADARRGLGVDPQKPAAATTIKPTKRSKG
jgi:hypothetical protein